METVDTQSGQTNEEARSHAHHHEHHHDKPMDSAEAVRSLLLLGQVALNAKDYESAVEAYASALQLEQDKTAAYNLASLYARGLGVPRDFVKAARHFHQAELAGNEQAGTLCRKCMFDYVEADFDTKAPAGLYAEMAVFVLQVYPEAEDQKREACNGLFAIASTYLNRGEQEKAAKVFRAAAEFGGDGYSQYYLALLYNSAAGLPKNDLASLYWLDCAVDNGAADVALEARDGLLDDFRRTLADDEFHAAMATLSNWCATGTDDVPANPEKAAYWRELA
ncbi:MAG: hypothetical protein Q4B54_11120 [Coriobacteriales bacterium]|nr:hypothetical protein [Coriobacteriales bacterium]